MIDCQHVHAGYAGQTVLHDISVQIHAHELVGIIGANGSGKSTLLRVMAGLLAPMQGSCHMLEMTEAAQKPRSLLAAFVPQQQDSVDMRVLDMVLLGRFPHLRWPGLYRKADYTAAHAALEETGCALLKQRTMASLSGGEARRVLLARALAQDTPHLLLDELNAGLDMGHSIELFEILEKRRRMGACIVTVMHDINLASLYSTRIIAIEKGCLVFDGAPATVLTPEKLQRLYENHVHCIPHPCMPVPQVCPAAGPRAAARLHATRQPD